MDVLHGVRSLAWASVPALTPTLAGQQPAGCSTDGVADDIDSRGSPARNRELKELDSEREEEAGQDGAAKGPAEGPKQG